MMQLHHLGGSLFLKKLLGAVREKCYLRSVKVLLESLGYNYFAIQLWTPIKRACFITKMNTEWFWKFMFATLYFLRSGAIAIFTCAIISVIWEEDR